MQPSLSVLVVSISNYVTRIASMIQSCMKKPWMSINVIESFCPSINPLRLSVPGYVLVDAVNPSAQRPGRDARGASVSWRPHVPLSPAAVGKCRCFGLLPTCPLHVLLHSLYGPLYLGYYVALLVALFTTNTNVCYVLTFILHYTTQLVYSPLSLSYYTSYRTTLVAPHLYLHYNHHACSPSK